MSISRFAKRVPVVASWNMGGSKAGPGSSCFGGAYGLARSLMAAAPARGGRKRCGTLPSAGRRTGLMTPWAMRCFGWRRPPSVLIPERMDELVDIGANLTSRAFRGDLPEILARARAAGVTRIVVTGTSAPLSAAAAELAAAHGLHATAGIHPHVAEQATPADHQQLRHLLAHPQV